MTGIDSAAFSLNLRHSVIILAMDFQLVTSYTPRGDQPRAIDELMRGLAAGGRGAWGWRGGGAGPAPTSPENKTGGGPGRLFVFRAKRGGRPPAFSPQPK